MTESIQVQLVHNEVCRDCGCLLGPLFDHQWRHREWHDRIERIEAKLYGWGDS